MQRGYDSRKAQVRLCRAATTSMGPKCVHMRGPILQKGRNALVHKGHDFNKAQCTRAQGP